MYCFNYDDHTLEFNFMLSSCENDEYTMCEEDVTLRQITDHINVQEPLHKSLYTFETWKDVQEKYNHEYEYDYEYDKYEQLHNKIDVLDYGFHKGAIYDLDTHEKDVCTEEYITDLLQQEYRDKSYEYARVKELVESILSLPSESYNTISFWIDIMYDAVIFMYIERHHKVYYYTSSCYNVKSFNEVECITYGYELRNVFDLPHIVEINSIEYVRVDLRCIVEDDEVRIFTQGKILCDVTYKKT